LRSNNEGALLAWWGQRQSLASNVA
jgi:hypothetical protein